ncbi:hypothetical protein J437_LFUL011647 [Ladona fulva]|uniref:Uncharacterized protein n=1 Tax=Ladona fulva TaxID=123851 RepID=A0A8K0K700_LADFU|nr:hypothetical protein J437_LFUL011647 [Ladona fulva]
MQTSFFDRRERNYQRRDGECYQWSNRGAPDCRVLRSPVSLGAQASVPVVQDVREEAPTCLGMSMGVAMNLNPNGVGGGSGSGGTGNSGGSGGGAQQQTAAEVTGASLA